MPQTEQVITRGRAHTHNLMLLTWPQLITQYTHVITCTHTHTLLLTTPRKIWPWNKAQKEAYNYLPEKKEIHDNINHAITLHASH